MELRIFRLCDICAEASHNLIFAWEAAHECCRNHQHIIRFIFKMPLRHPMFYLNTVWSKFLVLLMYDKEAICSHVINVVFMYKELTGILKCQADFCTFNDGWTRNSRPQIRVRPMEVKVGVFLLQERNKNNGWLLQNKLDAIFLQKWFTVATLPSPRERLNVLEQSLSK